MQQRKESVLFAFLSHNHHEETNIVSFLQSLIFQLLLDNPDLRPVLQRAYDNEYRQLHGSEDFNQQLFCSLLQSVGPTFSVLDGLSEIPDRDR
jgi:hypothetical protein